MVRRTFRNQGLQPVSKFVAPVVTPVCQRLGFVRASVVLDWDKIMTPAFSSLCEALKVTFPPHKKTQGTLHIRTSSAMALAISYQEPEIVERVNRYYGYQAVSRLVIHQGSVHIPQAVPIKPRKVLQDAGVAELTADLIDPLLQEALRSLGNAVMSAKGDENA